MFHVIGVNNEGSFGKVIFLCDNKMVQNICSKDQEIEHDDDNKLQYDADEYRICDEGFMLNENTVFELAEPFVFWG